MTFEGRTVTIAGEALLPGHGSPDFVAYSNSIKNFDAPDNGVITRATRERILHQLSEELRARGTTFEIEPG
jgi:hypothetical protein